MRTKWRVRLGCLTLAFGVCLPSSSLAWGAVGHRFITDTAVEELPAPLKSFFQTYKNQIKNIAATEPPGNHFIDIDYYPEFFTHTFPRDVNVLIAQYGATTVTNNGMGPWTAVNYYTTLRAQFAAAHTEADWTNLLATAGAMAHYLEDLHNPMHLTVNYNGQLTGQTGLHSRYETTLIQNRITAGLQLATNLAGCIFYPSLRDAIFDDIDIIFTNNAPLLAADLSATAAATVGSSVYYQHLWDDGCSSFTPGVMQRGADMVASAWYSAWRDAGFPQPPGVNPSTIFSLKPVSAGPDNFRFIIMGDTGQKLELQTSTNLSSWVEYATVTNLDGHIEIAVPTPIGEGQRFYRAQAVP